MNMWILWKDGMCLIIAKGFFHEIWSNVFSIVFTLHDFYMICFSRMRSYKSNNLYRIFSIESKSYTISLQILWIKEALFYQLPWLNYLENTIVKPFWAKSNGAWSRNWQVCNTPKWPSCLDYFDVFLQQQQLSTQCACCVGVPRGKTASQRPAPAAPPRI
jgi:hypothetical protein